MHWKEWKNVEEQSRRKTIVHQFVFKDMKTKSYA